MKKLIAGTMIVVASYAHHGVASLGVAGLEGPGAPLETTSSALLPEGKTLAYMKLDYANFRSYTPQRDDELQESYFWIYGIGYGFTPYINAYVFVPYYTKKQENSIQTSGFHDIKLTAVFGFKYDDGFELLPHNESLDDMEDWHFTTFFNVSFPTGNASLKMPDGRLYDPSMQLSFGKPSVMVGMSATKWFGGKTTFVADASYNKFFKYRYENGLTYQFADEIRLNGAVSYRLYLNKAKKLRLDLNTEANFLYLKRDKENGVKLLGTGGKILYGTLGFRLFYESVSLALGLKKPLVTRLNEEATQQGAEGKERYRFIFTFSTLF